jgi:CP family cyanate transporter-like MFS transporter
VGLLVAPVAGALAWMVLFGLGQGAALGLALTFILLHSSDATHTAELSGMAQTFGYLLSALGPVGFGAVHDVTGSWTWAFLSLLALLVPFLAVGLVASRDAQELAGSVVIVAPAGSLKSERGGADE